VYPVAIAARDQRAAVDASDQAASRGVDDAALADAIQAVRRVEQGDRAATSKRIEQDVALEESPVRGLVHDPMLPFSLAGH
jgi:hypothetical protein